MSFSSNGVGAGAHATDGDSRGRGLGMTAREREARENARSAFGMSGWSDRRNDGLGGGSDRMGGIGGLLSQKNYNISPDGTLSRNNEAVGRVTAYGGVAATPDSYMADPDHLGLSVKTPAYTQARNDMARARSMWGHEQSEKERTEEKRHLEQQINSFLPVNMSPDQRIQAFDSVTTMNPGMAPAQLQQNVANYAKTFGQVPLSIGGISSALFSGDYRSPEEARDAIENGNAYGKAIKSGVGMALGGVLPEVAARSAYGLTGNLPVAQVAGLLSGLPFAQSVGPLGALASLGKIVDTARMQNQAYGRSADGPGSNSGQPNDGEGGKQWHMPRTLPVAGVGGLLGGPWANPWSDSWNYGA